MVNKLYKHVRPRDCCASNLLPVSVSALVTTTIPFYYLITLGGSSCCSCSPKRIVLLVLEIEWMTLVPIVGCWYHFKAMDPIYNITSTKVFDSAHSVVCLVNRHYMPLACSSSGVHWLASENQTTSKPLQGFNHWSRNSASRYFVCFFHLLGYILASCALQEHEFLFRPTLSAKVATCNSLVFTLLSRPIFKYRLKVFEFGFLTNANDHVDSAKFAHLKKRNEIRF